MSSIFKKTLLVMLSSITIIFGVKALNLSENADDISLEQPTYIEAMKLGSSRFSQVQDKSPVDPSFYIPITAEDQLVAENTDLRLYYDSEHISFKVENKSNGYVFSTYIDNVRAGTYDGLLSSGLGIEYILVNKNMDIVQNLGVANTFHTVESQATPQGISLDIYIDGYCSTTRCNAMYPRYLEGELTLEEMLGFGYIDLQIGFQVNVSLEADGIKVEIPFDSIVEDNSGELLLSSIIVFPGFGATKMTDIPGYMVIPDGAGTLIRYEDNQDRYPRPYEAPFYGPDPGLISIENSVVSYPLSLPIFGMVHGVDQNAMLGIVTSGDMSARLFAYPNGAFNLDYNLIFTKFDLRKTYRQSFLSDGTGGALRNVRTSLADMAIKYIVLDDEEANYVGMANTYRQYLENNGTLQRLATSADIPLHLTYLMADSKESFFGESLLEMSSVNDVMNMHTKLVEAGIGNYRVDLMGWNDGGYSGNLPSSIDFENRLGSKREFSELIAYIKETGKLSLLNNYVFASEATDGIAVAKDVAKGVNRFVIQYECPVCVYEDHYMLYPHVSAQRAVNDLYDYMELGVGVLFETLGNNLISFYDSGNYIREHAYAIYQQAMAYYEGTASYAYPYAYALPYTTTFYQAPLYNSQVKYFDDLVPLLQTVLRGNIEMYGDYLNFNSYGREQLLMLVDFGVYPSFILTEEPSSLLKDTDISRLYTTEFDLWEDTVVDEYNYVNLALKHVQGSTLVSRETLAPGLVHNVYDNGVEIYINYGKEAAVVGSLVINGMDYKVGGVD
ncbi:MAG: hypothetical protein JXB20_06000 [Bacilli bacterium]|nr:hypothetical protein [Bacilli bacterium]